jgi:hypothetical protein
MESGAAAPLSFSGAVEAPSDYAGPMLSSDPARAVNEAK